MDLRAIGAAAYAEGRNVAEALRDHLGIDHNTPEIIEIAYDLQAGTYVEHADGHPDHSRAYAEQLARLLDPHLRPGDVLLDAGAGELTTLAHLVAALTTPLGQVIATDISAERLEVGRRYAERTMTAPGLRLIRAELSAIPLPDKSVDVATTNHALEPNGGREDEIICELKRIARRKLVLFEPSDAAASPEGKARMRSHGYIRDLAPFAESVTYLDIVDNPLNPTACYVIDCDAEVTSGA